MNKKEMIYHVPAMLNDSLNALDIKPFGTYVDATFGGGGHSRGILGQLDNKGHLYGFDQDADAEKNIIDDKRFTFVRGNFRFLTNFLRYNKVCKIDGLLADLGVSSHHLDDKSRGFSFRFDGALDMRMNKRGGQTAADVLNRYSEKQLSDVFFLYGELKQARRIAASIVEKRKDKPFVTVQDLLDVVEPFIGREKEKKSLARIFQALRIEVNREMQALSSLLQQSLKVLKTNGRLVVITYHSLEDRFVKNFMKAGNVEGRIEQDFYGNIKSPLRTVGKMLVPSDEEIERNPRIRSAKLRVAEKI